MRSIKVNSLPLKEVVMDIASAFDAPYCENCDEFSLQIPRRIGTGSINGINFEGGLGIIQYDCTFHEDLEIQFVVNEIHPLKFLYCIDGVLLHRFGNRDQLHDIEKYKKAIVASENKNGHVLCFKAHTRVVVNSLEISREPFSKKIACELELMEKEIRELFTDTKAQYEFYHDGYYSLTLADSFKEIQAFDESAFVRKLFMEGKAYQLLTKQIIEYQDDLKEVDYRRILRKSEINLIQNAAKILSDELEETITIPNLARRIGLNPNKLQEGFQQLYHVTINQFVHNLRLDRARDYLLNTDYTISQIADELGLASGSYFSKIFKEKYNITPSTFRRKYIIGLKKRNREG